MVFAPETVECFLQDLQLSLSDASGDEQETSAPTAPLMASLDWGTRKSLFLESGSNPAVVRCRDCRPRPFLCAECDVSMHTRHVLHNRDAMTAGFFQPLSPTTFVADKALSHCEMPEKICGCSTVSLRVNPGKVVAVVTINGRHDLSMPELSCHTCDATWAAGLDDLIQSGYWPATLHFSTIYETDVFYSFEEMKMAAPGLSCQAFLRMLDQRTFRFGRFGKISADNFQQSFFEWEAVRFEVENICKEESFICPACTPDMLRFQWMETILTKTYVAFRSEEKATFEGVFIANDEEVTRFVDYIHRTTKHIILWTFINHFNILGLWKRCLWREWSAARETSQRSTSKVDEEGLELAVCRHGVLLCALNMYRGKMYAYPLFLQEKLSSRQITFFCMDVTCKYWPYLQKVAKSCPELQHQLNMKPFLSVFHAKAHDFKC
ncbi:hypothetical protein F7725_028756 [Dissostichus mawsoni]|uniref:CxC3 like cysteine cluster domain-containing protein n=1 Tax=Dissostichus mawsoni TaxID=36200 RepID=A0A7J5XJ30_DISMA|nr:hypothetical protein F7725_028756 [Dissostichus mawsoni]